MKKKEMHLQTIMVLQGKKDRVCWCVVEAVEKVAEAIHRVHTH